MWGDVVGSGIGCKVFWPKPGTVAVFMLWFAAMTLPAPLCDGNSKRADVGEMQLSSWTIVGGGISKGTIAKHDELPSILVKVEDSAGCLFFNSLLVLLLVSCRKLVAMIW